MTKREKLLVVSSFVMILLATGIFLYKKNSGSALNEDLLKINLTSIKLKDGWGYDIKVGPKFSIHQDRIPAVTGNKPFISEEEALKTGQYIVEKIKKGKIPSITVKELDDLHIHY